MLFGCAGFPSFQLRALACALAISIVALGTSVGAHAADRFDTTVRLGGVLTQFVFFSDGDEAPTENINPVGQFHYSRLFVDARTEISDSVYVRGYARLVVNNWSTTNAEESYVEVGSPYGNVQVGVRKPFNNTSLRFPAPQAFLAVGDEIFSAMVVPRTNIPQRDGLTFKRFISRSLGVAYQTPRLSGLQVAVGYYPTNSSTEVPVDTQTGNHNAVDISANYEFRLAQSVVQIYGGYFDMETPLADGSGTKAWNASLQWRNADWDIGGAVISARLDNGARDFAWTVGILRRLGSFTVSTDYRSSNRRPSKGMPVGEYADRIMFQTDYRLAPGISVGVAGFFAEQRDINSNVWQSKGGTVGIKLVF